MLIVVPLEHLLPIVCDVATLTDKGIHVFDRLYLAILFLLLHSTQQTSAKTNALTTWTFTPILLKLELQVTSLQDQFKQTKNRCIQINLFDLTCLHKNL
jgi:hypothetical protein